MHTLHCDQLVEDVILINETNHVGPFLTIQEEREPHDIAIWPTINRKGTYQIPNSPFRRDVDEYHLTDTYKTTLSTTSNELFVWEWSLVPPCKTKMSDPAISSFFL